MRALYNWIAGNLKDLIEFLKSHSFTFTVKRKATEEVVKTVVISNAFFIFLIILLFILVWGAVRIHTIFWP